MNRPMLAVLAFFPAVASSQTRLDLRVEIVDPWRAAAAEAAVGIRKPIGPYLRAEASVGGVFFHDGTERVRSPRTEADLRFLLDPLAEQKWAASFAFGLGYVDNPYLLLVADLEGQTMGGWRPAMRVALGGGIRFGLVLRRAARDRR